MGGLGIIKLILEEYIIILFKIFNISSISASYYILFKLLIRDMCTISKKKRIQNMAPKKYFTSNSTRIKINKYLHGFMHLS